MSEQVREQPAPRTPFARLVGVIASPGETFEEISRRPGWFAPFVVYLVVFLVCFGVYAAKADWVAILTDQIESNPLMKLAPEGNRDQIVARATDEFRALTRGEIVATNLIQVSWGVPATYHVMALIYSTLFVMMGSLKDLKLGRAWGNLLLCLLALVVYFVVFGISRLAFPDSTDSRLLLTGLAAVLTVAGWIWLLNSHATLDPEFHRILSVCTYTSVIPMLSMVVLAMVSLVHQGDIQVYFDKVVPSNLGALLHPENPVVRALCNSLDIFSIWALVTLTIGFRTVTKLSTGMSASITFLPWGLFVMVRIALAAVFG